MKSFETWKTWAFIIGLLLFSAVASFVWPVIQEEIDFDFAGGDLLPVVEGLEVEGGEPETIDLDDYLLGDLLAQLPVLGDLDGQQRHPLFIPMLLTGILAAILFGTLFIMALPLALIYMRLDKATVTLKEDDSYQEKVATIEKKQKEELKTLEERQPPTPGPREEAAGWSVVSTSAFVLLFVAIVGFALADTFYGETEVELSGEILINPALPVVGVLLIITLLSLFLYYYRPRSSGAAVTAESDESAVPWGTIWVVVSGLIFLGIGIGLMLAVRAMGTG